MRQWIAVLSLILFTVELHALNVIKSAKIDGGHLLLHFSKPIEVKDIRHFALKGSDSIRYVFDFGGSMVRNKQLTKNLSYSSVRSFRISQFNRTTIRVVVEVKAPYAVAHRQKTPYIYKVVLPRGYGQKAGSPADLFSSIGTANKKQSKRIKKHKKSPKSIKGSIKKPKRKYTIVIDPGHGGKDGGAYGGAKKYMEKKVVLSISKKLRNHLKKLGFRVHMTRSSDRFIKLRNRTKYANKKSADAFVSIHANAIGGKRKYTAEGIETYFLQVTRSARSKRVAARENSAVFRAKDKISKSVILNLMTAPKIVMSNKLAIDVQRGMLGNVKRKFRNVADHGVRSGPFWVLVGAQMPAVLVEVGYITHPKEKKRLVNPLYQDLIAKGIAEGISNYFANKEREME
ncbi:MAG: AMIN domain-containing protein [Sulfurovum sp.]|nr:AMIN domain-containing protein [Sulfurovum sp.]